MVHIAGSQVFGHILNPNPFTGSTQQSDVTQKFLANTPDFISSGESTQTIIQNLQQRSFLLNLPQFNLNEITKNIANLIGLGEASIDISTAVNEQITIREEQRKRDIEQVNLLAIETGQLNERLSRQVQELGESLSNLGQGGFDPIKFFTDNPLIGGIGIGGLAVGGIVLLLVLR